MLPCRERGVGPDDDKPVRMRRGLLPASFGKSQTRKVSRDEAEDEAKRMKYVSEHRPALPRHKLGK